jgi:large subunit ribosomal protein L4
MQLPIFNKEGKETGRQAELNDAVFAIEPNDHAIYLDVKQYLANQRQGTHKTKHRGEVSGSTRKIKRQKGTGGARAGSIKSPTIRGGGRIFGPEPRDYSFKLNKKVKQLARKSALSYKAKENKLVVLEDFQMETPKTKAYEQVLRNLSASEQKTLLILGAANSNLYLSARNLPKAKVITTDEISTYHIVNADTVILAESSLEKINA